LGYGPAPDSPVWTLSEGASLEQATAWRGRRQDITGFYWMGARYYESSSGRFLSPDPYGHAASLSLYDYAGGDPVNFVDPTGRLQEEQNSQGAAQDSGFRFYEHPGVGQGGSNALVNVVEAERSRSMAMGAFHTNRAAAFTIGDAAASTMPMEVWNQYYGSYLQRTDAFMWMGYLAGGLEGALAMEDTTGILFGAAVGVLAAPVAAEGIIAGSLAVGNGVTTAATWTMTQANNIKAVGVSVYLMSRQPGAYQAANQFAEEAFAMFSGYDGPSISPMGFADDVVSGVRRSLNSVGDVASSGGSGPASGLLEVSSAYKSSAAISNFRSANPVDFVFDAKTNRFVIGTDVATGKEGAMRWMNRGHPETAAQAGMTVDSQVVGGHIRFQDGRLMTSEWSGRLGQNWTSEIRTHFRLYLETNGVSIQHIEGFPW
jgi:RHS repeat-associated protein